MRRGGYHGRVTESVEQMIDRLCAKIPDHPEPGVLFRDLTPLFADGPGFHRTVDALVDAFAGQYDCVAGVEARGFMIAAAVAYASGAGIIPVRKAGKLPRETISQGYELEYGSAVLELQATACAPGARVLVVDDVLATGGTAAAACALVEKTGAGVVAVEVVLELPALGGRDRLGGRTVSSLLTV